MVARSVFPLKEMLPLVFLLLLCSIHSGQSQSDIIFDHISVEQGLSNVTVTAILQDHEGFMWFGTLDGLCRYDGYDIVVFRNNPLDTTTISDNTIWALCEDRDQCLWVGTYNGGLNKFDRTTQGFTHFKSNPNNPTSLSHNTVRALFEDRSGKLWVGTYGGGVDILDRRNGQFHRGGTTLDTAGTLTRGYVRSICEDPSGRLWIGTRDSGVYVLNPSGKIVQHYIGEPRNPHDLRWTSVGPILYESPQSIWIGTSKGLVRLDEEKLSFRCFVNDPADVTSLGDNNVTGLQLSDQHTIWVGTLHGGLNRLDKPTGRCVRFAGDPSLQGGMSDGSIRTLYRDPAGCLWIGTSDGGVNKINTERKKFGGLQHDPGDPRSLSEGEVWAICEDRNGILWIGTDTGGLNKVERSAGKVTHYRHDPRDPNSLSSNAVSAILEDSHGDFWVGTRQGGLNRLDRTTGRWTHFASEPGDGNSLSSDAVFTLFEDREGTLWVGTWEGGLNRFDRTSSTFTRFLHDPSDENTLSHNRVTAILEGSDSDLWITTEGGGLNMFSPAANEFRHFRNDPSNPGSLSNDRAYCVYEDTAGMLWIGTANGLNMFDRETHTCRHIMMANGLASDYVRAIVGDHRGNLWLGTTKGLTKFHPGTGAIKNYDLRNGLQGEEFSGSVCRTADGRLILGGPNGVTIFDPDSILDNTHVPPVVITAFQIFEKPVRHAFSMLAEGHIRLSYKDEFFSFAFSALDYANPQKNSYAYMMEGFDKEWIHAGARRYASYTNLDPGSYVFRVRGSNNDGLWNLAGASIRIVIDPPFWETWWFRILAAMALGSILLVLHNYRVSRLLEIERMRVRIAGDLHDDIGSNLSSIALVTDMVRESLTPHLPQRDQLLDVARTARSTADSLRDIVWIISPEHDKVDDIVLRMKDSAARLLPGMEYAFDCGQGTFQHSLDMEFRRNVLLIYKEALNNTAKHSGATKVDIVIREVDGMFVLSISDNGMGFDPELVQRGNGLNNMRRRAEKIGGNLSVTSTAMKGTTVRLNAKIP